MTYKVKTSELKRALGLASKCLDKQSGLPVLSLFRFDFSDGLKVTASNLDQTVDVQIAAEGSCPITDVLIDGRKIAGIINLLADEHLEIEIIEGKMKVKRSAGTITLATTPTENFPETPDTSDVENWTMFSASTLYKTFRTCMIGTVDGLAVLQGGGNQIVEIRVDSSAFRCFATDGHRLSIIEGKCETEQAEPYKIVLPVYAIRTLLPTLDADATVFIGEDKNHIFVKLSGTLIYSFRKVCASFPNVDAVLNHLAYERFITVDSQATAQALQLVGQLASDRFRRVNWQFTDTGITFTAVGEGGNAEEAMPAKIEFEPDLTAFDYTYILPVLKQMDGEVELAFSKEHIIQRDRNDETIILSEYDSWSVRISSENGVKSSVIVQALKV